MNKKIVFYVFIAFLISFFILYFFQFWSKSHIEIFKLENNFFSSNFDTHDKKIFIIGSSEVGMLNATYINVNLSTPGYTVHNLAIPSDTPSQRLNSIEQIILLKPQLVVYGVGYRDFSDKNTLIKSENSPENKLLPDPSMVLQNYRIIDMINGIVHIDSPKFVTVTRFGPSFPLTAVGIHKDNMHRCLNLIGESVHRVDEWRKV